MGAGARARLAGALPAAAWLLAACGGRSSLDGPDRPDASTGAIAPSDAAVDVRPAPEAGAARDSGADGSEAGATCRLDDLSTWRTERYRDDGDYDRAAVAVSGAPWVALKVHGGNVVLASLSVDAASGIVLQPRIEIPGSPVYPVALDVDDRRFVLLTTSGINWNGDVELWRVDRLDGTVTHVPVGQPPSDPAFTVVSAVGLPGDDVVVAYAQAAANQGTVELRDDGLQILQTMTIDGDAFTAVRAGPSTIDLYAGATSRVRAEGGALTQLPVDPAWQVIGGLDGFLVEMGTTIQLTDGAQTWSAPWPHTQLSPPAVVRTDGARAAFSLETELTAVVGHVTGAGLEWLSIEASPDAPGTGLGLLPRIEPGRLGLFYLGLEIPNPQQPLRYYGLACP